MSDHDETDDDHSANAPSIPLRRNRNFQLLWTGQVLSDLGSQLGALAYPLLILALTHSPVIAGVVGTATAVVAFGVRLPAGALADMRGRVNNALLQAATGLAALSLIVAGVLVEHTSPHWAMGDFAMALAVSTVLALSLKGLRNAEAAVQLD